MRTWRLLFAVGLLAALLVPASSASAEPHETLDDPHTECAVDGQVTLTNGVDTTRSTDHYTFTQTGLTCVGLLGGSYNVQAEGDTTDIWHGKATKDGGDNGEDCDQGGSAQESDELHTGTLDARGNDSAQDFNGKVHFARLGTTVLADGPVWNGTTKGTQSSPDHFFQAELEFIPAPGQDCVITPVTDALLVGTGEIYAGTAIHDCSLDDKSGDPHC